MRPISVGIGEMKVSSNPDDVLRSYALGSCVGMVVLAFEQRIVGMLHVALPDSRINLRLALERPGMFADTGVVYLLQEMERFGCLSTDLVVKIAGGACILDQEAAFEIGKRNILAVRKALWRHRMGPVAEDVGDVFSRTMSVTVNTGIVTVSSPWKGEWVL